MWWRIAGPLVFGLVGAAILLSLGIWQSKRLIWKEDILAEIDRRIIHAPVDLPAQPSEAADEYLAVKVTGQVMPGEIHILVSSAASGPGYRVVAPFETGTRRILVDRGFVRQSQKNAARALVTGDVVGNLLWPDEMDAGFTPKPNFETNTWFARDLPAMAAHLEADPILVVLRMPSVGDDVVSPWPVSRAGIPNNHLNYAITWFLMAAAWLGMTGYWLWRIRRQSDE